MRLHRLISILLLIEAKGNIKAKELAAKLEISLRTVYRDIDVLSQSGIPITATTGPNGGIGLMEGYSAGISHMQEEEIINLYLGGIGIHPDKHSEMAMKLHTALMKLEKGISGQAAKGLAYVKKRFFFDEVPWWGDRRPINNLDVIVQSIFQVKKLRIAYKKFNGDLSLRITHPYGIVVKGTDWYLIAYCEKSKEIRTFKCERIEEGKLLEKGFEIPEDFSVEGYWLRSEAAFKNMCSERDKYPVTIKLHKSNKSILSELEIYETKEDTDYIVAIVNMYDYKSAAGCIMRLTGRAEVLLPKELRTFVKSELRKAIEEYK